MNIVEQIGNEFSEEIKRHHRSIFKDRNSLFLSEINPDIPLVKSDKKFTTFVAIDDSCGVIGWHKGFFETSHSYYMQNSAVLPEHRRKGVYTALISRVVEEVKKNPSIYYIDSLHHAANNDVIIAKLKNGFYIHNFEVNVQFGSLIRLRKYLYPEFQKVFEKRIGYTK